MYNKKGFLLAEETLKIILAVIAIGFLVYLLFSVYKTNKDSGNLELAKASMETLVSGINNSKARIEIYNPSNWIICSWPNPYSTGFGPFQSIKLGMPKFCSNLGLDNCLCICKKENPDSCDKNGICRENSWSLLLDKNIKIDNPPITLFIDYDAKKILKI